MESIWSKVNLSIEESWLFFLFSEDLLFLNDFALLLVIFLIFFNLFLIYFILRDNFFLNDIIEFFLVDIVDALRVESSTL